MNTRVRQILEQITTLETELQTAIEQQKNNLRYQIEGKRITFEQTIKESHLRLKMGIFHWFLTVRPQNYLTMPIIYGMIIPLAIFDLFVTLYQVTCFPIYGIAKVRRGSYLMLDHQHLAYLNIIEKAHCMYCSYAVGLTGYASEILARTEQYFCPIKHAHKILSAHSRYQHFLEYGEADDLHEKIKKLRGALAKEKEALPAK